METAWFTTGRRLLRCARLENGQTMAEYGLILAAVFVVAAGAFWALGPEVGNPLEATAALFDSAP